MSTEEKVKPLEKGQLVYVGPLEYDLDIWPGSDGQMFFGRNYVPAALVIPARTVDEVAEPLATVRAEPVDRKQAGEMRQSEREAFRTLAVEVSMSESLKGERETIEALEKWVDAFGRDRFNAGIEWARERAEPARTAPIEDEANSYVLSGEQRDEFRRILEKFRDACLSGDYGSEFADGLRKIHEVDAAILAKRAFKAGYRRGVNAVHDDAESGIDRKGFVVTCVGCRIVNHYPGGFAPGVCGNCGEDISNQPRYREVNRVEDVPVFEPIEEEPEPIARASHHDAAFSAATGDYALIKLYCQPHQAEKVYAAALELVDRKGEAISGPWYGPGVARERSEDLFGESQEGANERLMRTLETIEAEGIVKREHERKEAAGIEAKAHYDPGFVSATEYTNALNKAYSDGYKTGHMHGSNAGRWLDGMAVPGREPVEEPAAEPTEEGQSADYDRGFDDGYQAVNQVHVTISKKGRITISGSGHDVFRVLGAVMDPSRERSGGARIRSSLWGMSVVKTEEVPEGVIVVKVDETGRQAIREAFRAADRRNLSEAESDKPTQQE